MIELSAGEAVAAMTSGAFTAEAYAEALLRRCEEGAYLNGFITLEFSENPIQAASHSLPKSGLRGRLGGLNQRSPGCPS